MPQARGVPVIRLSALTGAGVERLMPAVAHVFELWNRRLPTRTELDTFTAQLRAEYQLPEPMWAMISGIPPNAVPMHALRTLISALALFDGEADDPSPDANQRKAIRLLAADCAHIQATLSACKLCCVRVRS